MPIIPRYENIGGDVPTARAMTPDVNAFPGAEGAIAGVGIEKAGLAVADAAGRQRAIQGYLKAQTLKSELAVRLEAAMERAKNAPQKTVEGIMETSGDPGGLDEPVATTSLVPRSQSLVPDYLKAQKDIVDDINKKAGTDSSVTRHLTPAIERLTTAATVQAQKASQSFMHQENHATVMENADILAKQVTAAPPPPATQDATGTISLNPDDDRTYTTMRNGVAGLFDSAAALGGMPADMAEKGKLTKLAKMDHGRAVQTMHADPASWVEASTNNRNGWSERLTGEAMTKLDDKAAAILKARDGGANAKRLQLQRDTEDGYLLNTQPDSVSPLTRAQILQDVTDKKIDSEHATKWIDIVDNLTNGKWKSDGPTRVRVLAESQRPDVDYATFQRKVEGLIRPGGLNTEDAQAALNHARSISEKRNDRSDQLGFHTYSTVHGAMTAQLKTPPTLLGQKFDDTSDVIRGRASNELSEVALRSGYNPETIAKWQKERLPEYTRQIVGISKDTVKVLSSQLPVAAPLVDPKTGFIEKDEIDKTAKSLYKKYGIQPGQKTVPVEFDRALKVLDEIESLTEYQREQAAKKPAQ